MATDTIGIVGAGKMGCGMAQVCAESGASVVLIDVRLKSLVTAVQMIAANLSQKVAGGSMTPETRAAVLSRITTGLDFGLLRKCSFCIEVVLENDQVKSVIQSKIRAAAGSNIIIASNTVNLCIAKLAKNIEAPENFMGMVFAYPPLTALDVKLIPGPKTSAEALSSAQRIIRAIGKNPIVAPDRKEKFHIPFEIISRGFFALVLLAQIFCLVENWLNFDAAWNESLRIGGSLLGAGLTVALFFMLEERAKRMAALTKVMAHITADDLTITVPYLNKVDVYGGIARLLDAFKVISSALHKAEAEEEGQKKLAAEEKRKTMDKLVDDFNRSIGEAVSVVASAATALRTSAKNLSETADQTSRQSAAVASATEESSASVQTVASAAEELSASISEINRQVDESSRVAINAVDEVKRTNVTVSTLSEAATQIGDVVKLIQNIASQTNLLALNATIEAARAGEAGKGFAVVASEVKNLAKQTGVATEEISKRIGTVQSVSTDAANAIKAIGTTIEQISEISESIAKAIQQQTAATREISHNVQQASAGNSEVASSIVNVTNAATQSRGAADEVLQASDELSQQADHLRGEIQSFLTRIKQG
ncbi:MAG: 3-hydroxyacyl-CoA dehydrogenase NAD-binding domain-containing protein [Bdellovibrionales bacterium]